MGNNKICDNGNEPAVSSGGGRSDQFYRLSVQILRQIVENDDAQHEKLCWKALRRVVGQMKTEQKTV